MKSVRKQKRKIRVGIWGLGRAGWGMHCAELDQSPDLFTVAAACDIEESRLHKFEERYPGAKTYTDGEAFLADPDIDLISVAVRSPEHTPFAIRALEAGKYVFIEKPVALSLRGLNRLIEADKKYPGRLFCRHNRRFESCFNHLLEIINSGKLGDVFEIKIRRNSYGFRDDWQSMLDCGGGLLNNWGPHIIDQALRFLQSPLKNTHGYLRRTICFGDAEDHVKFLLEGRNGRVVDAEICNSAAIADSLYTVYGTRGSAFCRNEAEIQLKYLDPKMKLPHGKPHRESPPMNGSFGGATQPRWVEKTVPVKPACGWNVNIIYPLLYESIVNGAKFPVTLEEAAEVVRVSLAIRKQNPSLKAAPDNFRSR